MELQKVVLKVPAKASNIDMHKVGAEFTKWIQESSLPGVMIDVADYTHMFEGPGVILAAHEYIFSMDQQDGVNGLKVSYRLNSEVSLSDRIQEAYDLVVKAGDLLKRFLV